MLYISTLENETGCLETPGNNHKLHGIISRKNRYACCTAVKNCQDRQCTCTVTMGRVRVTIVAMEKKSITYFECVFVALVIQRAVAGADYIAICGLSGSTTFSTLSHKRLEFRGKKLLNIKYVLIFCITLV